jgi:hypothetical protein
LLTTHSTLTSWDRKDSWRIFNNSGIFGRPANQAGIYAARDGAVRQKRPWWLTPVILATQEAEIRRITVRSQVRQIVHETLSQKSPSQKRAGGVAQSVGPEFKPQYHKKKKKCPMAPK